jgi:hypothetical protein
MWWGYPVVGIGGQYCTALGRSSLRGKNDDGDIWQVPDVAVAVLSLGGAD